MRKVAKSLVYYLEFIIIVMYDLLNSFMSFQRKLIFGASTSHFYHDISGIPWVVLEIHPNQFQPQWEDRDSFREAVVIQSQPGFGSFL